MTRASPHPPKPKVFWLLFFKKVTASLTLLLPLTACGFTPLYAGSDSPTSVSAQLEQVQIANIPDRPGQILRQTLESDMQRNGTPVTQLYTLSVTYTVTGQAIAIQPDTSSSRTRYLASATWSLTPIGQPDSPIAQGNASAEDAENVINEQYFAAELETNTLNQQLADQIAAQITAEVAAYFKNRS